MTFMRILQDPLKHPLNRINLIKHDGFNRFILTVLLDPHRSWGICHLTVSNLTVESQNDTSTRNRLYPRTGA